MSGSLAAVTSCSIESTQDSNLRLGIQNKVQFYNAFIMNFSILFAKSKYVLEKVSCKKGYI